MVGEPGEFAHGVAIRIAAARLRVRPAALVGTTPDHAGRLLDELVDAHLLQEPAPGRYRFHDLPRAHANATLADEDTHHDRHAALTRLFDHYIQTATRAITTAHTPHQDAAPRSRALDWLNAELVNLLSTAIHATRHNRPTQALAAPLHYHVRERARTTTTRFHELATLCAQAQTHLTQGRYAPATTYFEQALKIAHPMAS